MGLHFPNFLWVSLLFLEVILAYVEWSSVGNCTKTAFAMAGKEQKKYMPGKKGPKFITTKLLFLNKKHNRTTRITGVQKWVRKKGLERPLFFQQSCNVMSHRNPSLLWCISSFCILLFATTQESYLSKIFDSFLVEAIEWSDDDTGTKKLSFQMFEKFRILWKTWSYWSYFNFSAKME